MVLPLQRELDLEGAGASENRRFVDVCFQTRSKRYLKAFLDKFIDFRSPRGANMAPNDIPKGEISVPFRGHDPERIPGCHLEAFSVHVWSICELFR